VVLMVPAMQASIATASGPVANWTEQRFGRIEGRGWQGQFAIGLLLGTVWSPCVGPTLGAASLMAARGENLGQVALTMTAFGLGAAAPLLVLGLLSRDLLKAWRGRLLNAGKAFKIALGALLTILGLAVLSGTDKALETWLVEASPAWLTALTTSL
jgi:cytochrome c biogenesis protein CcdA